MLPAAVLSVVVTAEGIGATNAQLASVQTAAKKTAATVDAAGTSLASTGKRLEKAGTSVGRFGKAATKYYATPLLAAAGAAVYFGQKYEKSILLIDTHTDTSRKNLALYKREILDMSASGRYTQGPNELAEAMYHVASDGFKGHKALDILSQSAKLAMVGQSNMAETTYAVVSALKNQIKGAMTAKETIAGLNAVMGAGDTKMQEVTGSMNTGIIPAAKQMGLSFEDVGAALDLLTQRGVPAQQGAYRLAMTFQMLIPHTEKAEKAFERLHLGYYSLTNAIKENPKHGLLSAMELLEKQLEKFEGKDPTHQIKTIEEIFGGGRTSRGAISMLQNLPELANTYERIQKLKRMTPQKIRDAEQADVNRLKEAWVQLETLLTEIGMKIIPALVMALHGFIHGLQVVTDIFFHLPHGVQAAILIFLALTVALAFVIRFIGFLMKSFGQLIGWFAKTEEVTSSAIVNNEALAASYEGVGAAAEASAAAQTAALEEVATAQKIAQAAAVGGMPIGWQPGQQTMSQLIPEGAAAGGQMSLFATEGSAAAAGATALKGVGAGAEAAATDAGAAAATGFGAGFVDALPAVLAPEVVLPVLGGALAAYGGYKLGQYILGGHHNKTPLEHAHERVTQTSKTAASAIERGHRSSHALLKNEHQIAAAKKGQTKLDHRVKDAQDALNKAQKRYGDSSQAAAKAQHHLNVVKAESIQKDRQVMNLEKLHGPLRTAEMRSMKTEIADIKEKKQALHEESAALSKRLEAVQKNKSLPGREAKEKHLVDEIKKARQGLATAETEGNKITAEAGKVIGPKFMKYLEHLHPELYNLKKAAHAAGEGVKDYKEHMEGMFGQSGFVTMNQIVGHFQAVEKSAKNTGKEVAGPFKTHTETGLKKAGESVKNFESVSLEAFGNVGGSMNNMLGQMNSQPVQFGVHTEKHKKAHHKMRGGHIAIGAAVGDSVPAVLEKGEYVMNREAVAKVGVHKLNEVNFGLAPRFQEGGEVGNLNTALMAANRIDSKHYPYLWGGGHGGFNGPYDCSGAVSAILHAAGLLNRPMVSGELASYGKPGPGPITIYANPVHAFMKIGGRFFGTSGSNPGGGAGWFPSSVGTAEALGGDSGGAFAVRHPVGIAGGTLPHTTITGPDGKLKKIAQAATDRVQTAAQKYIDSKTMGKWGGGDMGEIGGNVLSEMGATLFRAGANKVGAAGPIGNAYRESLWNPAAEGTGGGGLFGFTSGAISLASLKAAASRGKVPWTSARFQTEFMLRHGGAGLIPTLNRARSPEESARIFMEQWERPGIPALAEREHAARKAFSMGWQKGGSSDKKKKEEAERAAIGVGNKASNFTQMERILHGISGKHPAKAEGSLRKYLRKIAGVGIKGPLVEKLSEVSSNIEKYDEYANNAGQLTATDEQSGNVIQGKFKGATEGEWLNEKLTELLKVRKLLITAAKLTEKKQRHVRKILREAKKRLIQIRKVIKTAEQQKHQYEKKIKDIEKLQGDSVKKLEKEKKAFENDLSKAQKAKHPNKPAIQHLRDEIKSKQEEIGASGKNGTEKIKSLNEKIHSKESFVKDRAKVEDALNKAVPQVQEKYEGLGDTKASLLEGGGSAGKFNFTGLQTVQGRGTTMGHIVEPPVLGSVGGEIFDVEKRLKDIKEEAKTGNTGSGSTNGRAEELKDLEKEIDMEWMRRYIVSQYQYGVLQDFPTVRAVPYAGAFAVGGSVVAKVGERGPEYAVMPNGSQVLTETDARRAVSADPRGKGTVMIDEMHIYPDGTVGVKMGDDEFEAKVRKVTRKDVRRSQARTPGGLGINRRKGLE